MKEFSKAFISIISIFFFSILPMNLGAEEESVAVSGGGSGNSGGSELSQNKEYYRDDPIKKSNSSDKKVEKTKKTELPQSLDDLPVPPTNASGVGGSVKQLSEEVRHGHTEEGVKTRTSSAQSLGEKKNSIPLTAKGKKNASGKPSTVGGGGAAATKVAPGSTNLIVVGEHNQVKPSPEHLQKGQIDPSDNLRTAILASEDGKRPIREVVLDLVEENNPLRARELILTILLRKKEALPVLKEILRTGPDVEKYTVLSLLQKNLQWQQTSEEILGIINNPNTSDRILRRAMAAASALQIQQAGKKIWAIFSESDSNDVREVAILALGILQYTNSKKGLESALQDPSERIALAAAESLGRMDNPSGYFVAVRHLDHSNWFIRKLAVKALGHIATDEALDALELRFDNESSSGTKAEMEIAINLIAMKRMARTDHLTHLQQLLDSKDRFVSRWAHKRILKEFPDESVLIFKERSKDKKGEEKNIAEIYLMKAEELKKVGDNHE